MTERKQAPTVHRANRRVSQTPVWKSALLASAIGAVLLGWGILGWNEAGSNAQAQQNTSSSQALDVRVLNRTNDTSSAPRLGSITIPDLPQAPVFRQAPARTRGS
ncbi:MAG: hypothetical protein HZY76_08005 [Anaerolineae bacterium]|nr:MAG: hypothetical protein HZY76_08005 [Anaerolineae bacterium]